MINFRMLKYADYTLWISVGILVILSFVMIYSATQAMQSRAGGNPFLYIKHQLLSLLPAILGMLIFMYLDYKHLKQISVWLYVGTLLLLVAVLLAGPGTQGAQRWLTWGWFSLQPSELAKLVLIAILARHLELRKGKLGHLGSLAPSFMLTAIPFFLIFKQPDLGTALVFIALLLGMLFWAEAPPFLLLMLLSPVLSVILRNSIPYWVGYIIILAAVLYFIRLRFLDSLVIWAGNIGVGFLVPYIWGFLKGYQKQRLLSFLNPGADPLGAGYHSLQSKIAVGGGGILGKGFLAGTQTQLQFIPQQYSDFIFSVVGEEWGLLGATLVLILFSIIIWRAIKIAMEARDFYGSLLASGIAVMYATHLVVSVGMTLGIMPVVGIPLPLMSFGGTSLVVNLMAIGILQSIVMRQKKLLF